MDNELGFQKKHFDAVENCIPKPNRLESIKERLNGYIAAQGYANQRTPILVQQRRELLVKFEENVTADMNFLLQRLERYEKALKEIRRITPYGMYHEMIDTALED